MIDNNFDQFLKNSLKASELVIDSPISEIEQKIAEKIERNRQAKKHNRKKIVQVAIVTIVLVSASGQFLFPQKVSALKEKLVQQFVYLGGNISVMLGNTSNQSQTIGKMEKEIVDFQPNIEFRIMTPTYIPEGFEFDSIQSPNPENKMVILSFVSDQSEFKFKQTKVSDNFSNTGPSSSAIVDLTKALFLQFAPLSQGVITNMSVSNNATCC